MSFLGVSPLFFKGSVFGGNILPWTFFRINSVMQKRSRELKRIAAWNTRCQRFLQLHSFLSFSNMLHTIMSTPNLKPNRKLENEVNELFGGLRSGPWFNSGNEGTGPVNYDRGQDSDFNRAVEQEYGVSNFEPSRMEMPYAKLGE
jgi:hypothetical protein